MMKFSNGTVEINRGLVRVAAILCLTMTAAIDSANAQVSGRIAGNVTDQSQAVISGAKITLRNQATGVQQSLTTNSGGNYAFPAITVGTYDLAIDAAGFKPFKRSDVVVNIGSSEQIDTSLEVAEQAQSVNVTEDAMHVETSDTQL